MTKPFRTHTNNEEFEGRQKSLEVSQIAPVSSSQKQFEYSVFG